MSDYADLLNLATALHKSRLWKTGSVEQALAVILMGRELGIGPTTALSNIIISAGKPTLGAALVGALIQKSGRYFYRVLVLDDTRASVEFWERAPAAETEGHGRRELGISTFTMQDALKARLGNSPTWQQYPRNLLLARAITNGARWYCPEVFGGAIYDPEEVGTYGGPLPAPVDDHDLPLDADFLPTPSVNAGKVTIETLLEKYSAEQIVSANGGNLPSTDAELEAVADALERDAAVAPVG